MKISQKAYRKISSLSHAIVEWITNNPKDVKDAEKLQLIKVISELNNVAKRDINDIEEVFEKFLSTFVFDADEVDYTVEIILEIILNKSTDVEKVRSYFLNNYKL